MSFVASQAFKDARLVGGIAALLDDGTPPAYALLADSTGTVLVTLVFTKPAAVMVAHELVFAQAQVGGDQILVQGNAAQFELFNGAGVSLGTGDVTDMAGAGALKISGTAGTLLYAGARAILGSFKFV